MRLAYTKHTRCFFIGYILGLSTKETLSHQYINTHPNQHIYTHTHNTTPVTIKTPPLKHDDRRNQLLATPPWWHLYPPPTAGITLPPYHPYNVLVTTNKQNPPFPHFAIVHQKVLKVRSLHTAKTLYPWLEVTRTLLLCVCHAGRQSSFV